MNRKTIAALFLPLFVFVIIAIFTIADKAQNLNDMAAKIIQSFESPLLTIIMKFITNIGEWFVYLPIALLLLALPQARFSYGLPTSLTLAVSAVLNTALKLFFAIPRPDTHRLITETGYGFPSGHAMNGMAFVGICVCLFIHYSQNKPHKIAMLAAAVCFMLLMGFSRIYLGVHNLTDVLAGYAAGIFLFQLVFSVVKILSKMES